jgi:hypothetical protein
MRKSLLLPVVAAIALTVGCARTDQPNGVAVNGYQSPGGWGMVAQQKVADSAAIVGTSAYVGASADGSVMGFISADGTIRWYKASAR